MNSDKLTPTLVPVPTELEEEDELREPTKEEIMEDLRIALRDVLAGEEGIPAREGLEALRRRIYGHADRG